MLKVLLAQEEGKFALELAGAAGEFVDFGQIASLETEHGRYLAICDDGQQCEVFEITLAPRSLKKVTFYAEEVELSADVETDDEDDEGDEDEEGDEEGDEDEEGDTK